MIVEVDTRMWSRRFDSDGILGGFSPGNLLGQPVPENQRAIIASSRLPYPTSWQLTAFSTNPNTNILLGIRQVTMEGANLIATINPGSPLLQGLQLPILSACGIEWTIEGDGQWLVPGVPESLTVSASPIVWPSWARPVQTRLPAAGLWTMVDR